LAKFVRKWRRKSFPESRIRPVALPDTLGNRFARGISSIMPPTFRNIWVRQRHYPPAIPPPNFIDRDVVAGVTARHRVSDLPEFGEVIEPQRHAVDQDLPVIGNRNLPLAQVPACDIISGIADHLYVVEKAGNEIAP